MVAILQNKLYTIKHSTMKSVLHIISSPNGSKSFSNQLGNAIIQKIQQAHPGSTVRVRNLTQHPFPHLEEAALAAFGKDAGDEGTDRTAAAHSDQAIAELEQADIIVISVPFWNFGIPSVLKAWVDHIARAGKTFRYTEQGVEGLVQGKTVYVALASGGIYSSGPMQGYDFASTYLKAVLGFMGMTDLKTFRVEGVAYPGQAASALEKGIESIAL